jgi:hypothetical protein
MNNYPKAGTIMKHKTGGKCEVMPLYEFFHPHYKEMGVIYVKMLEQDEQPIMLVDIEALEEI